MDSSSGKQRLPIDATDEEKAHLQVAGHDQVSLAGYFTSELICDILTMIDRELLKLLEILSTIILMYAYVNNYNNNMYLFDNVPFFFNFL